MGVTSRQRLFFFLKNSNAQILRNLIIKQKPIYQTKKVVMRSVFLPVCATNQSLITLTKFEIE